MFLNIYIHLISIIYLFFKTNSQFQSQSKQNSLFSFFSQDFNLIKQQQSLLDSDLQYTQCECNFTPNQCDFNCCCDLDCPIGLLTKWILDEENSCIDQKYYSKNTFTTCFDSKMLLYFNLKRGMRQFNNADLFCVSYDNSSQKSKYYSQLKNLTNDEVSYLLNQYNSLINKKNFDEVFDLIDDNSRWYDTRYFLGDPILLVNDTRANTSDIESFTKTSQKYMIYNKGSNGECFRNEKVVFMKNTNELKCKMKINSLSNCLEKDWKKIGLMNYIFNSEYSNSYNNIIKPKLNKIYIKNFTTGEVRLIENFNISNVNTTLLINNSECICSNILNEANYYIKFNENNYNIENVFVDIVLYDFIIGKCNSKVSYSYSNSVNFINNNLNYFINQGSPGYSFKSELIFAYERNSDKLNLDIMKDKAVLSIHERNRKTCLRKKENLFENNNLIDSKNLTYSSIQYFNNTSINSINITNTTEINLTSLTNSSNSDIIITSVVKINTTNSTNQVNSTLTNIIIKSWNITKKEVIINNTYYSNSKKLIKKYKDTSNFDLNIKFGKNIFSNCIVDNIISANDFKDFCQNKRWLEYNIFNLDLFKKGYVAVIGNPNFSLKNDWIKFITDKYDDLKGVWNDTSQSCYFPNSINVEILHSKAGSPEEPHYYILSAKAETNLISYDYNTIIKNQGVKLELNIRFLSNKQNKIFTERRENPTLFPLLPNDIANPFAY